MDLDHHGAFNEHVLRRPGTEAAFENVIIWSSRVNMTRPKRTTAPAILSIHPIVCRIHSKMSSDWHWPVSLWLPNLCSMYCTPNPLAFYVDDDQFQYIPDASVV